MKKDNLSEQGIDPKLLEIFKALADPVRIQIIKYLNQTNCEIACGEVGKAINISKSSGTYHFKLLEDAGLITTRREAREKYVALNMATFNTYLADFFEHL